MRLDPLTLHRTCTHAACSLNLPLVARPAEGNSAGFAHKLLTYTPCPTGRFPPGPLTNYVCVLTFIHFHSPVRNTLISRRYASMIEIYCPIWCLHAFWNRLHGMNDMTLGAAIP